MLLYEQALSDHPDAWPFKDPVDARDVPDYYDIIKDPIGMCLVHLFIGIFPCFLNEIWLFLMEYRCQSY